MKPHVSVIMPVYNAQDYLEESILSILNQSFRDFEFIIVEDGSSDDSPRILERYARQDQRISLIHNENNIGLIRSLNSGLKAARGKYIARMDADDVSLPDRLAIQVEYLDAHEEIFLVGTFVINVDSGGKILSTLRTETDPDRVAARLPKHNCIFHPTIMFRNTQQCFYREKMQYVEDYDLYLNLLSQDKRLANVPIPLLRYRRHPQAISLLNTARQMLFVQKAREYYKQRIQSGQDEYESFDPRKLLDMKLDPKSHDLALQAEIVAAFSLNHCTAVRKLIAKSYGPREVLLRPRLLAYLLASYCPPGILARLKRFIKWLSSSTRRRGL